ncbi:sialate O-acetylesterase [Hymenobacter sp. J193]|uniref:sialate O-acetylesterase n=1 Tax=Hymenobacter sp. J193 TaxID=2898429 RepID=UPI002150796D|nr:sialate O-acetylesterase [Hymenobacter sp. J193]MCR5888158.1 sialate O-acetylesterase [Hymenobacter sp. J193]
MIRFLLLLLGFGVVSSAAQATVRLPRLVGSHMVLQRDARLPLWGWAAPGEKVSLTFQGKTYAAQPDASGKWTLTLPAMPAGGPYTMTIKGSNTLELTDILVGDVWLASGQSNMEWALRDADKGPQEIAAATFPQIRLIDVPNVVASRPQAEFGGAGWQVCSPATAGSFSAVAYFFARDLHQRYHVPIGLITAEWGGTPAESWVSAEALKALPEFTPVVEKLRSNPRDISRQVADFEAQMSAWRRSPAGQDRGHRPGAQAWFDVNYAAANWPTMTLPGVWEATPGLQNFDGVIWFRKEVALTAEEANQPAQLNLAQIDDNDSTWFNGTFIGRTNGYNEPRRYTVPAALVKPGRNVLTVRVVDNGGGGGIWGEAKDMILTTSRRAVPLAGNWAYQVAYDRQTTPRNPFPAGAQNSPTVLYNAMIAPLLPYAIKGAIWYQGESNASRAEQYRTLFPALIRDWRMRWGRGDFPFLFVQLANYMPDQPQPADYEWAELREAQARTLSLPRTGMATAIDIGNPADIHPRNKQDVGRRLALAARQVAYGDKQVVASGPTFEKMQVQGQEVRITFRNTGGGLELKDASGSTLKSFAIAGADRKFVWAQGRLEGNTLVLSSPQVPAPVAVRYAWSNNPFPNLYNKEGLPAPPFRTDDWPGLTTGRK